MKVIYAFIIVVFSFSKTQSQSLSVYAGNSGNFPLIKTFFYAKDAQGKQLVNLNETNISIKENGVLRKVVKVSCPPEGSPVILSSVLVMDISSSMKGGIPSKNIDIAKAAALTWIKELPSDGSECAVTSFDNKSYLNQDFTTDKQRLTDAVNLLSPSGGTNYDAGFIIGPCAALNIIKRAKYKHVIIFLTDGEGFVDQNRTLLEAASTNAEIYCVGVNLKLPSSLKNIAEVTKGAWFENANSPEKIEEIYRLILKLAQALPPCELIWETGISCEVNRQADILVDTPILETKFDYSVDEINLPKVKLSSTSVRFTDITPGNRDTASIIINAESDSVIITSITSSDTSFIIENTPAPEWRLNKGENKTFRIIFTPTDSLLSFAQIRLEGNLCDGAFLYAIGGFSGKRKQKAVLKILAPNGGEKFPVGDTTTLRWTGVLPADTVSLDYSTDNGSTWLSITKKATGLSYLWRIPPTPSNSCLFRAQQFRKRNADSLLFLNGHSKGINQGCFNNEGTQAITVSNDRTFIIWDAITGLSLSQHTITDNTAGFCVDWSSDGKKIAIGGNQGVGLYDASTFSYIQSVSGLPRSTYSCAFSDDGRYIVSTGGAQLDQIIVWGTDFNAVELPREHTGVINRLTVSRSSPKHITILSASQDRDARRTEVDITADITNPIQIVGSFVDLTSTDFCTAYVSNPSNPDTTCAIFNKTGQLRFFPSQSVLSLFAGLTSNDIAWSPDGKYIAVALQERLEIVDLAAGKVTRILDTVKASATSIRWDVYSSKVLATFDNSQALIWQINDQVDQQDVSDSLWEIVQPILASLKDVDFGKVAINTSRDSVVESILCISKNPLSSSLIDSAIIVNDPDNVFRIISSLPTGFSSVLPACQPMELGFSPKKFGFAVATLQLFSNGQMHEVSLIGNGFDLEISYPDVIDFEKVHIGAWKDSLLNPSTVNSSRTNLNISKTSVAGPDIKQFLITGGDTVVTLNYQQFAKLQLRFAPTVIGRTSSRVRIDFSREGIQPISRPPHQVFLYFVL
ncbi:MAG: VWA domain-containing protein [Ignavibacteriae bacterium]|nr:VWA domain-containing protein [Ignavibacteriota bacterium]